MVTPLYKKLVNRIVSDTSLIFVGNVEKECESKIIKDNLYPVIRKGKIIRWERMY